jgi:serine O-acetyltransferase
MVVYRLMQFCQRYHLAPFAMIWNKINVICGGCIIGRGADFGDNFVLLHSNGTVINAGVKGGNNIYLEHQVTIGSDKGMAPVLGDDIYIGAGAKVIGSIRLGSRVRVGANAVVVKDVPDGCTVVGIPAKIIRRESDGDAKSAEVQPHAEGVTGNGSI